MAQIQKERFFESTEDFDIIDIKDFIGIFQNVIDKHLQEARLIIRKFLLCPMIKIEVKNNEISLSIFKIKAVLTP